MLFERTRFEEIFEKFKKKSIDNSFIIQEKDVNANSVSTPPMGPGENQPAGQRPLRATFLGLK